MVFTKNDILLESSLYGEIERISTACDMMIESFIDGSDEDTFEEAGNKVFNSIKSAASSIIEKIKKFIQDSVKSIREKMDKRKIQKAIDTLKNFDMKDAEKMFKVKKGPDVLKAYNLLMKYEDLVEKYVDQIDTLFEGVKDSKRIQKLTKFAEEVNRNSDKIISEINDILTSPDRQITYNKNRYEAILRLGLSMDGNYEQFGNRIAEATNKLNNKINETFQSITESVILMQEAEEVDRAAAETKSGLMGQLNRLKGFVVKHKKAVIAISSAVAVTAAGVLIYKNTPDQKLKRYDKKRGEITKTLDKYQDELKSLHVSVQDPDNPMRVDLTNPKDPFAGWDPMKSDPTKDKSTFGRFLNNAINETELKKQEAELKMKDLDGKIARVKSKSKKYQTNSSK